MRIGELADLAGVTVRTIRHYHQAGILAEPARRPNGYRDYTVDHLVLLIRLGHLTRSGLTLAQAGEIVADAEGASAEAALDEVDEALRVQIEALTAQRQRLAEAREGRHLGLSPLAAALVTTPADVPASTLYAHLHADEEQSEHLAEVLSRSCIRSSLADVQERFAAIDAHTAPAELDAIVAGLEDLTQELFAHLPTPTQQHAHLLLELVERTLNAEQRALLRRLA